MNVLGEEDDDGNAKYSEADLKAITKDPKAPHAKVVAAKEILRGRLDGFDKSGRVPRAADSLDRLIDRTEGRSKVTVEFAEAPRTRSSLVAELIAFYAEHPVLLTESGIVLALMGEARKSVEFARGIRPLLQQHQPALLETLDQAVSVPSELSDDGEEGP